MDQLCTKCGAGVPAGAQFCAACGTPVSPAESATTASFTPVQPPPESAGYTTVPPAENLSSAPQTTAIATPAGYSQVPPASAGPGYGQVPASGSAGFSQTPAIGGGGYGQVPPASAGPGYSQVPASGSAGYSQTPASGGGGYGQVPPAGAGGAYGSAPMAPPPSGGNTAVKVILIVVAIFVGLGILGAGLFGFAVWRVARAVHQSRNGELSMSTPSGAISANSATSFTADELGTDIYPGAEPTTGGMKMSLPGGSMVTGVFLTSDSKDAVRDFYKSKLGLSTSVFESQAGWMLSIAKSPQDHLMITVSVDPSENKGKTKIVIVHTTRDK